MSGTVFGGTYTSGIVLSNPAAQNPATIAASGSITNTTTLQSGDAVYAVPGYAWTLANFGTVTAGAGLQAFGIALEGSDSQVANSGDVAGGVSLAGDGLVSNAPTGTIAGGLHPAVAIAGTGTVVNLGTLIGGGIPDATPQAITLAGGTVGNADSGSILGLIRIAGPGTVANYGAIAGGRGLIVGPAMAIAIAGPGVIANHGTIGGGISLAGAGAIANYGIVQAAAPLGMVTAVGAHGGDAVSNSGTIAGFDTVQGAGGVVTGAAGVAGYGPTTVSNSGLIASLVVAENATPSSLSSYGVSIAGAGRVTNSGTIVAGLAAYNSQAAAYAGAGVAITGAGTVANYGLIAGYTGIAIGYPGAMVDNVGTIVGYDGVAVSLAGGGARVVAVPGAVFQGVVSAAGAGNTLELAGGGAVGGPISLGTDFTGFGAVAVDAGASWMLSGGGGRFDNNGIVAVEGALVFRAAFGHGVVDLGNGSLGEFAGGVGPGQTVAFTDGSGTAQLDRPLLFRALFSGFGPGDTIDLAGRPADAVSFAGHHLFVTEAGSPVADLRFAGPYNSSDFMLSPDGSGGTDITFASAVSGAEFWTFRG